MLRSPLLALALVLAACRPPPPACPAAAKATAPAKSSYLARLKDDARSVEALVQAEWVRAFVRAAGQLPPIAPRAILRNTSGTRYYSEEAAAALSADMRAGLWTRVHDEELYYVPPSSGTPLDYARPLDLVAAAGMDRAAGKRVLDFGYGGIGHLRMLASLGMDVVGVDVDPVLLPLYASVQRDLASVPGPGGTTGKVSIFEGRFPSDPEIVAKVGTKFDLIVSKNVLKRGYIHPAEPVPPHQKIDLGVTDEAFVRTLFEALVPGGRLMIYNVYPPQTRPYRPWADGRSPFDRAAWEAAGFRVVAFDQEDSPAMRAIGRAAGWSRDPSVVLERDYFAMYTLLEKPAL